MDFFYSCESGLYYLVQELQEHEGHDNLVMMDTYFFKDSVMLCIYFAADS